MFDVSHMGQLSIEGNESLALELEKIIPTDLKIKYIQSLIDVGFDTIDLGSFVSRKVIPQLSDTGEVIRSLDLIKASASARCASTLDLIFSN